MYGTVETKQSKEYKTPQVQLIKMDKPSKAFLAASGGELGSMNVNEVNSW